MSTYKIQTNHGWVWTKPSETANGNLITYSEWSAIKALARRIANELGALPNTTHQARMQWTKLYYRTHHARQWTTLEAEQPLLKLCSSNWKADHVLGNSIQAILSKERYAWTKRGKKNEISKRKGKKKATTNDSNDSHGSGISSDNDDDHIGDVDTSGTQATSWIFELIVLHKNFNRWCSYVWLNGKSTSANHFYDIR